MFHLFLKRKTDAVSGFAEYLSPEQKEESHVVLEIDSDLTNVPANLKKNELFLKSNADKTKEGKRS